MIFSFHTDNSMRKSMTFFLSGKVFYSPSVSGSATLNAPNDTTLVIGSLQPVFCMKVDYNTRLIALLSVQLLSYYRLECYKICKKMNAAVQ